MPKKATNYDNTVIYKIVCNDLSIKDCYVGHTTDFRKRKNGHKTVCNNANDKHHNLIVYQFIRAHGGWENFSMVLVEKFPCKDANEARARERLQYEQLGANLNGNVPNRSKDEWHDQYYEQNKDLISEYNRQYSEQYREKNRDLVLEKQRQYLEQNRDQINARRRELRANKKLAAAAAATTL